MYTHLEILSVLLLLLHAEDQTKLLIVALLNTTSSYKPNVEQQR